MEKAPSVLVVEDEAALARMVERVLSEEGYSVRMAAGGRQALEAALAEVPDVVILDLSLPDRDGLAVCRDLRGRDVRAPVIMLTARDAVPDRVRGLDAGADDYLTKPFAFEELLARIRAQLRRTLSEPERLRVGDLVMEPSGRRAFRGEREVFLSDQEFRLLEILIRHPGQVMSRQRLLDHVWGYASAPASNVVDLYVHYLRQKVEAKGEPKLIRTVRSVGYVLRA